MELPSCWELRECKDYPGRVYYYNSTTNESTWVRPIPFPGNSKEEWPPMVYVSHILIRHSKSAHDSALFKRTREEAKKIINEIHEKLIKGTITFENAAKESSDCETKERGGELGWIKRKMMPPEFEKVAWGLGIGQFSSPFETVEGYHIVFRRG